MSRPEGHAEDRTRGSSARRGPLRLRGFVAAAGILLAGWLLVVFAGALGEAEETARRAELLRAENAELRRRVEAGRTEIELIRTDLFLRLQARAYGMGESGERPFTLAEDAPSPEPLPLLGGEEAARSSATPLDAWLDLLFGA
jgi:cell division protein FtsB